MKVRGEGNARLSLQITVFALSISSSDELSPKRTAAFANFFCSVICTRVMLAQLNSFQPVIAGRDCGT